MKKLLNGVIAGLMLFIPILFSGCTLKQYADPWDEKKEENGFYYYIRGENGNIAAFGNKADGAVILGYRNANEYIDELTIPQKIGGYNVKQIGAIYHPTAQEAVNYGIDCININRIIINNECSITDASFKNLKGEIVVNADVRTYSITHLSSQLVRFNIELQSLTDYKEWSKLWEYDWTNKVKVEFDSLGGKQTTFAYVLPKLNTIIAPDNPKKDGYKFSGWYKDETFENAWNFETDTVTENLTLFAKWIEE
ncbi:MAG: InlB B-repeat-containing protein [Roseburia sp.]|nr:InlB B-repeat-containing protein [Roseburia sp.]